MSELTKEEKYEITTSVMSGIGSLRQFCNTKGIEWLEDVSAKLTSIIEEIREDEEKRNAMLAEKESLRLKVLAFAAEMNISPEEINVSFLEQENTKKRKPRKERKASTVLYRYTDPETGKTETYNGRGRKKKGLQALLDAGHNMEEFLIEPENQITSV